MAIKIFYQGSSGNLYNLKAAPLRIKSANFHAYAWTRETVSMQYGERLVAFGKKPQVYATVLYLDQVPAVLRALHDDFERDIVRMTPGRIIWNGDYIECYITASSTHPTAGNAYIANEIEIYCPSPFWITERSFALSKYSENESDGEYLDYPYDYAFDYAAPILHNIPLGLDFYGESAFRAVVHGPVVSPSFAISGVTYGVNITLLEGESLVLDTRPSAAIDRQIYKIDASGNESNVFYLRTSDLVRIPAGPIAVEWSRAFDIDLTVYQERSEPNWM